MKLQRVILVRNISYISVSSKDSMATKRPASEESSSIPQAKKPAISLPPLHVPSATSQEDLDIKVLQVMS